MTQQTQYTCSICKDTHIVYDLDGLPTDFPCVCQVAKEYQNTNSQHTQIRKPRLYSFDEVQDLLSSSRTEVIKELMEKIKCVRVVDSSGLGDLIDKDEVLAVLEKEMK